MLEKIRHLIMIMYLEPVELDGTNSISFPIEHQPILFQVLSICQPRFRIHMGPNTTKFLPAYQAYHIFLVQISVLHLFASLSGVILDIMSHHERRLSRNANWMADELAQRTRLAVMLWPSFQVRFAEVTCLNDGGT